MSDDPRPVDAPLPELLARSAASYEISTQDLAVEDLLAGEAARHFPEPRDRRRDDAADEDLSRLRAILKALDEGSVYPDDAAETTAPVHSQFYQQF